MITFGYDLERHVLTFYRSGKPILSVSSSEEAQNMVTLCVSDKRPFDLSERECGLIIQHCGDILAQ